MKITSNIFNIFNVFIIFILSTQIIKLDIELISYNGVIV